MCSWTFSQVDENAGLEVIKKRYHKLGKYVLLMLLCVFGYTHTHIYNVDVLFLPFVVRIVNFLWQLCNFTQTRTTILELTLPSSLSWRLDRLFSSYLLIWVELGMYSCMDSYYFNEDLLLELVYVINQMR
jgi:hypothetical protein